MEKQQQHKSLLSSLLAANAFTGCDSACCYHGIGKKTAIKVTKQRKLFFLGELSSDIQDVVSEATAFIGDCYGISDGETMSDKRQAFVFCTTLYAYIICYYIFFCLDTECGLREPEENFQVHQSWQICLPYPNHFYKMFLGHIISVLCGSLVFYLTHQQLIQLRYEVIYFAQCDSLIVF